KSPRGRHVEHLERCPALAKDTFPFLLSAHHLERGLQLPLDVGARDHDQAVVVANDKIAWGDRHAAEHNRLVHRASLHRQWTARSTPRANATRQPVCRSPCRQLRGAGLPAYGCSSSPSTCASLKLSASRSTVGVSS